MASTLDNALQRALSIRLNLQISLSQLPIIDEWMDIHLDRWLEHNPMPPDMPDGQGVSYLTMLGSDLSRLWWGSWGDPRGFVPRMSDYFKLCNIAKSDAAILDQIGQELEPKLVGSWIGVWGGKLTTGWHFLDPQPWPKVEAMFGTHEAKFQLKKWMDDHHVDQVERFAQAIGDEPYSEIEVSSPDIEAVSEAFATYTGAPLDGKLVDQLRGLAVPHVGLVVRIRAGKIVRVGALIPGIAMPEIERLCSDAGIPVDPKLPKLVGALGEGVSRVEYVRAGERAGVDIYLEPSEPGPPKAAASDTN